MGLRIVMVCVMGSRVNVCMCVRIWASERITVCVSVRAGVWVAVCVHGCICVCAV